jgi:hypothetical protein
MTEMLMQINSYGGSNFSLYLPAAESKITRALPLSSPSALLASSCLWPLVRLGAAAAAPAPFGCEPPCAWSLFLPVCLASLGASNIKIVVEEKEILNVAAPSNQG